MMIPITRKEKYINEIAGGGNTAPETPYTREELFFADILGEVVAPSPITRAEKYLAKIANKYSGELPEPVTRIEHFLARAAGMDVTIPTPITREEMFWADYALIGGKELSGIPPLTFNAIAGTLKNYRIYGDTVGGESVGDRTGNLFNYETMAGISGKRLDSNGNEITDTLWAISGFIPCTGNAFTISKIGGVSPAICVYDENQDYITGKGYNTGSALTKKSITITTEETAKFVRFSYYANKSNTNAYDDLTTKMLNVGTEALPYEPYGYKVPVTVSNGVDTQTIPIYLTEQIKKVGDEAEYIDYREQKLRRVGADDIDVNLPELPTLAGTNVLTVGTEVQPSNVYIKYEGAR